MCCVKCSCVTVRRVSLWKFDFYCEYYVCNASVERNLTNLIVYLITYANLCCVFSARWWSVMHWGARSPTEIEHGFFSGFPRMQSDMFVILCNIIFNYCNFNTYVYIFTCGPYIEIYVEWPFMPKNRNFKHSIWLILYSKPLDLKCMKWIKSTLLCDC